MTVGEESFVIGKDKRVGKDKRGFRTKTKIITGVSVVIGAKEERGFDLNLGRNLFYYYFFLKITC